MAYFLNIADFDQDGTLVANAPPMPVHPGSMDMSVRGVIDAFGATMGR